MSLFRRLLRSLGFRRPDNPVFDLDQELIRSLQAVAAHSERTPRQTASDLLAAALERHDENREQLACWHTLTPREQQVAALTCLGYTNRQIADRLVIAPSTVQTHGRHLSEKFGIRGKSDLRQLLAGWDFSAWEEAL